MTFLASSIFLNQRSFILLNRFFFFLFEIPSFFVILHRYAQAKYFNFLVNEESCDNNNDNTGNYVDIVVVNEKSLANDNVARRSVI